MYKKVFLSGWQDSNTGPSDFQSGRNKQVYFEIIRESSTFPVFKFFSRKIAFVCSNQLEINNLHQSLALEVKPLCELLSQSFTQFHRSETNVKLVNGFE
jgi:hypothetical protein